ncbi:MAG: glycosyltransferase family 2 protein [Chloroflexi bacterium]|nr:glycosyltransferase family 2 protein [Chloroflexota bacterium]
MVLRPAANNARSAVDRPEGHTPAPDAGIQAIPREAAPGSVAPPPASTQACSVPGTQTCTASGTDARATATAIPEISVVVVTFRSGTTLLATLGALRLASRRPTELIVVDNGDDPDSRAIVRRAWPTARIIVNVTNRGFAAAVNQGIASSRGRLVLLLNPDAEVEPSALDALVGCLEREPRAGVAAARLLDADGQPVLSAYPFLSLATVAWRHFQVYRLLPNVVLGAYRRRTLAPNAVKPVPVDWAQGACLLIQRAVFEAVGGFDERFIFYCEEVDFARRAALAGWQTYYVPTACARHLEGSSSRQVVPFKLASHYISKLLYFEKHAGPNRVLVLRGLLSLDLALRYLYRLVRRPPDASVRQASYVRIIRALLTERPRRVYEEWRAMAVAIGRVP